MPVDVLVVGAGPAGSVAALVLARAGVRAQIVDRAAFPRDKLCGDSVNPGSLAILDRLGIGRVRECGLPMTGMIVSGPFATRVTAEYPETATGVTMTRRELDRYLVEAAVAAGASFDDRVTVDAATIGRGGRVTGASLRMHGGPLVQPARLVLAADGRASRLGRQLALSTFASSPRRWAFGAYFAGVHGLTTRGEMHVRRGGYIGIAPLRDGLANVCVVRDSRSIDGFRSTNRTNGDRDGDSGIGRKTYDDIISGAIADDALLRDRFEGAQQVSPVSTLGPLAVEARGAGCPGLLLAGDAAGFVDPMTGDGLRFAIRGGMLAAEAALRELETGEPAHASLHAARAREFSGKWRINRGLRLLVGRPAAVTVAAVIARRWPAPVRALIAIAGDVDLARRTRGDHMRALARAATEPS